jgi:hypothetical protein
MKSLYQIITEQKKKETKNSSNLNFSKEKMNLYKQTKIILYRIQKR